MPRHCSEDDLILYYYGEGGRPADVERHLDACAVCRAQYQSLCETLALVAQPEVPARSDDYGHAVWLRIRQQLPEREVRWWQRVMMPLPPFATRLAVAGAALLVVAAAFLAGRMSPRPAAPASVASHTDADAARRERVRLGALGDHLERSERLLVDLVNDRPDDVDIADEQAWATELVASNRLYRDAAVSAGDQTSAAVLDELERNLLDIVHAPSKLTATELTDIRSRLEAAALLFKVRILHDELRDRQDAPAAPRKTT